MRRLNLIAGEGAGRVRVPFRGRGAAVAAPGPVRQAGQARAAARQQASCCEVAGRLPAMTCRRRIRSRGSGTQQQSPSKPYPSSGTLKFREPIFHAAVSLDVRIASAQHHFRIQLYPENNIRTKNFRLHPEKYDHHAPSCRYFACFNVAQFTILARWRTRISPLVTKI